MLSVLCSPLPPALTLCWVGRGVAEGTAGQDRLVAAESRGSVGLARDLLGSCPALLGWAVPMHTQRCSSSAGTKEPVAAERSGVWSCLVTRPATCRPAA